MFNRKHRGPWPPTPPDDKGVVFKAVISNIREVVAGGVLRARKTAYGSGTGWWLGVDPADDEAKFDIGTPTDYFRYDQTNGVQIAADGSTLTNIDGGNIQTETIVAGSIVVGTLTFDRMVAGALSNNLVVNPGFEDGSDPHDLTDDGGATWSVQNTIKRSGTYALQHDPDGQTDPANCYLNGHPTAANYLYRHVSTFEGKQYNFTFHAYRAAATVANNIRVYTRFYDATASLLNAYYTSLYPANWTDDTWTECTSSNTAPAGAAYVVFTITILDNDQAGSLYFDDIDARTKIGSGLIEADAVLAEHIAADTITAAEIAADTITAAQIAANTITAGEIVAGTITVDEIAANTITAAKFNLALHYVDGTFTDDSPGEGYVAWTGCTVTYNGTTHSIDDGNTNNPIVWWDLTTPTAFQTAATYPAADTTDDIIIGWNTAGTFVPLWQTRSVHGENIIADTITANQIAADTITAAQIAAGGVTATEIDVTNLQAVSAQTGALTVDDVLTMGDDGIITWMSGAATITDDYMDVALTTSDRYAFRFLDGETVHAYLGAYKSANLTQLSIEVIGPAEDKYAKIALAAVEWTGADPETTDFIIRSDTGVYFGALNYAATRIFKVDTMDAWLTNKLGVGKSPTNRLDLNFTTEDLGLLDAGSAAATEQDWIEVTVGGNTGYIRVYAAK